jgi:thiosulfate/3-mercaptopyruvate sulfurtransferase
LKPLVTTEWLAAHLDAADLRVVDVRWYLDPERSGREAWRRGHVQGAVFLDVDSDLSDPGGAPGAPRGRHPWPAADVVAAAMSRAGIGDATRVVAYDDAAGGIAARAWYVLRAFGHDAVAVLDGGIVKWTAEGRPLETREPNIAPARFTPRPRPELLADKAELADPTGERLLLDARARERYRGDLEPIDPRPGHIPGARSAPFSENLTGGEAPVFRSPEELRRHYAGLGCEERKPVVYCGSGVTACHDLLALELAGLRGRLYAGSWSEWSSDPSLPAATGDE